MNKKWKFSRLKDRLGMLGMVVVCLLIQNLSFCWSLNDEGLALLRFRDRVMEKLWCSENLKDLCLGGTLTPELRNLVHIKSIFVFLVLSLFCGRTFLTDGKMFYSHQLLARKASLGQIWMAATMHAKINRRKLDKLDIIKICEEILNPSVPMALRLSGILMGGVVIVYERKVKLLYDDVTRLLVEINEAWKAKSVADPTVLPKGKSQARKEAVTLPENEDIDIEGMLNFSNGATTMFQQTFYFAMYVNNDAGEEDPPQQFHLAEAENITLPERFDSCQADAYLYSRLERFDIEGDEETQLNFTSGEHTQIHIPPSPPRDEHKKADTIQDDQHPEQQVNQPEECQEFRQNVGMKQVQERQGPIRSKTRRTQASAMDFEQTIIPGHLYQSWLLNSSDIVSRRGRKRKRTDVMATMKIVNLMELPPIVLIGDSFTTGSRDIYYPRPLLDLWMKSTRTPCACPSEQTTPPLPPEPLSSTPPGRQQYEDSVGYPFEDFHSGVGSQSLEPSIDKQRRHSGMTRGNSDRAQVVLEGLTANLENNGLGGTDANPMATPGNSDDIRSILSSASGQAVPSDANSGRSNRKRPYSASGHSNVRLEPVFEVNHPDVNFEVSRLHEHGPTSEPDFFVETGPTQTQKPINGQPLDKTTDSIRRLLKSHFDTAGAPQVESLDHLTAGRTRKEAAMFFYKTCVLATHDAIKVEQKVAYGEILISRGPKMG
ncbi:hypothetical protein L3X38_014805 [Prunus dulcis]|uniref:Sister chromatid cohesion 1 protein 1 n=1 Tax=Prunus dulcis TaxID=3755 RepID=A0AAD4ZIM9_PRUDU|nr:hypothetical protein L3X38_014805 [Prunus dulcis]